MLKVYQSNSYKPLTEKLAELLASGNQSVFQSDVVVYQAMGVRNRLPMDLANINTIFSNVTFISLSSLPKFLTENYVKGTGKPLTHLHLQWQIFNMLGDAKFKRKFPKLAEYCDHSLINQFQLAGRVTALFHKYAQYRPDMLGIWQQRFEPDSEHESWQAYIWKNVVKSDAVVEEWFNASKTLHSKLLRAGVSKQLRSDIPCLYFFGISSLTKTEVELIRTLSSIVDVYLFCFLPSDKIFNNSNQLFEKLAQRALDFYELIEPVTFEYLPCTRPAETLLGKLQNNITEGLNEGYQPYLERKDNSIRICSNYSPNRELETLYHYLLEIMGENPEIKPKDIVVLLPDIENYIPYIRTVFERNSYQYNIPYFIERESIDAGETPLGLLKTMLDFDVEDFSAEMVLQLLEKKLFSKAFGITDLEQIRQWIVEANIRRDFRGSGNPADETYIVSFDYGLKRLVYGFALGEDVQYQSDGITFEAHGGEDVYPVGLFGGSADIQHLCQCKAFVEALQNMILEREGNKTVSEWIEYANRHIVQVFIYPENEETDDEPEEPVSETGDDEPVNFIQRKLLEFVNEVTGFDNVKMDYLLFKTVITQFLESGITLRQRPNGGVTFAPFKSMQGLNFKVVAMLGVNYDALPHRNRYDDFDLMKNIGIGEPNRREEDKYTFLKTILSAEENLYISYIGRSSKDNSKRPPSILIEMLMEHLHIPDFYEPKPENHFWIQHPLHSFSKNYNTEQYPNLKRFTVSTEAKTLPSKKDIEEPVFDFANIELGSLIRFFKDPAKIYLQKKLGYYTPEEAETIADFEVFELKGNNLAEYFIKQFLMEDPTEPEISDYIRKQKHYGLLPLGQSALYEIERIKDGIKNQLAKYIQLKGNNNPITETAVKTIGTHTLSGRYTLYGAQQLFYCTSSKDSLNKYKVEAHIQHLFCCSLGMVVETILLKKKGDLVQYPSISQQEAEGKLQQLIEYYIYGHTNFIPLNMDEYSKFSNIAQRVYGPGSEDSERATKIKNLLELS